MTQHLRHDLDRLGKRLLALGAQVEEAVRRAIAALLERRRELALEVINGDMGVDEEEVEIEEDCLKVLALHQPVAADLRFTAAVLKINSDLERIGDLAVNIAKRALLLGQTPYAVPPSLRVMMENTLEMVRESLDSFVRGDVELARHVLAEDDGIDRLNREIIRELVRRMEQDHASVEPSLAVLSVSRHLERIGDHATNIAEDVVYMVEGEIIRHHPEPPARGRKAE